ncbi:uncharacterized protein LOC120350381 isoform X2 [Nilaparvata lugens]|nr:uncharacterized protein LOC111046114 isoform X2 [Nilaparvata lugens]XP_039279419.1 uncharacterized protein LOC120350381 isoform X2 [Nilaparvata lugens]
MGLPPMPHSLADFSAILQREEWLHLRMRGCARRGEGRGRGGRAIGERGGEGNLDFMNNPWPADQAEAEQLSQRQMAYLARVAVNADDAVAGEGDLVCVACAVHKRSYMTQPCGHFVLCGTCVLVHRRTVNYRGVLPQPIICPVCRSPLTGYCRVFQ